MNTIFTYQISSDLDDYFQFHIDAIRLDEILENLCGNDILGLYPTLSYWLDGEEEKRVVWSRILPKSNVSVCPILMCPDDCDLFCVLVSVEIEIKDEKVLWKRFGLDKSYPVPAENAGTDVEWFKHSPSFVFDKDQYIKSINQFIVQFSEDRKHAISNGLASQESFVPSSFQINQ